MMFQDFSKEIDANLLKFKEMEYFEEKERESNEKLNDIFEKELTFTKIVLPPDKKIVNNNIDEEIDDKKEIYKNTEKPVWDPIPIRLNNDENEYREIIIGRGMNPNNIDTNNNINDNKINKKEKMSKIAEAGIILSNYGSNYVDFNYSSKKKDNILPNERKDFGQMKFNNEINNKQSFMDFSIEGN